MDLFTFIIGIVIGLAVGFAVAWVWANSISSAKKSVSQSTEAELKALLALRAKNHVDASKESIQNIELELGRLVSSMKEYEESLIINTQDYSKNTFFGEHASMFLRNSDEKPNKSIESKSTDNQPRDFANSGSGVFVGSSVKQAVPKKEKSTN